MRATLDVSRRVLLVTGLAMLLACDETGSPVEADSDEIAASLGRFGGECEDDDRARGPLVDFADLEIFLEFNSTDDDLGVQVFLDAVGWDRIVARDPRGRCVLGLAARRELGDLGLTELRFESAEPSPAEVLSSIRPGEYRFSGRTADGGRLVGTAELSHDLPPAPVFTPGDGAVVDPANTVIAWDQIPGLAGYEVIVVNEETGANLDAVVGPGVTSLTIPAEFMEPGSTYKAEVLAIAENGNKTITEHVFTTQP